MPTLTSLSMRFLTRRPTPSGGTILVLLLLCACSPDPAGDAVARSIEVHGGDAFERIVVEFRLRDDVFALIRDRGRFHYERVTIDQEGREIRQVMDNDGTYAWVDGVPAPLAPDERASAETAVNSVVYFGFLPFRLDEPAVRLRDLGLSEIAGRDYRKVEVTFDEDGGGRDWEDRFIYWFSEDDGTLDYLAYRFHTGEGGTRFRRAVNRREVGGIVIQDYENYTADPDVEDIAEYDRWFEGERLTLVSEIRLEDVRVSEP